ncbi:glutamine--fructose-6-phosphate transaminase (isomerizing) [Nitrospinae bacterium AH_259_B05_G02_I21]|nr:glutamine--fructose-6-phosphate transaminase (isomerizing) [Nitrospinae bacterium AH_259_B05_G02_I21]
MCGIIGYVGHQQVVPVLLEGLKRLEYRGYDSAGIAMLSNGALAVRRCKGKIRQLEELLKGETISGTVGIGHTRWATHGRPSEENAHPHRSGGIVVVHNGIIENYLTLKHALEAEGRVFASETDTEVIVHLIDRAFAGNLEAAVRQALKEVQGAYSIAAIAESDPDKVVVARMASPLVVGLGQGEYLVASDIPAILHHTRDVLFLDDGEVATATPEGVTITTLDGTPVTKEVKQVLWNPVMAEKGGYKHFMLKEIFEQPRAIWDTIRGRLSQETGSVVLHEMNLSGEDVSRLQKIALVACGTSYHSALVGKYLLEQVCGLPVEADIASEFRYRDPLVDDTTLGVFISQSGETADTLAAVREAKRKGTHVLSICNVVDSSISRESDGVLYTHAGPEIGVASSKAFTAQLAALYILSIYLGRARGRLSEEAGSEMIQALVEVPKHVEDILEQDALYEELARHFADRSDFLYLGRGINYPIALEGALKLKEISYIHAEGYPAGEMKHGPIALIDESMPVVALAPRDAVYEKMLGNIEEVKTRDGIVIAFTDEGNEELEGKVNHLFTVPQTTPLLMPILLSIPMQLIAYHIAVRRGCDVDQPRNLAKSVTVE